MNSATPDYAALATAAECLYRDGGVICGANLEVLDLSRLVPAAHAVLFVDRVQPDGAPSNLLDPLYFSTDFLASDPGHPFWPHVLAVIAEHVRTGAEAPPSRLLSLARKSYRGDRPVTYLSHEVCLDLVDLGPSPDGGIERSLLSAVQHEAALIRRTPAGGSPTQHGRRQLRYRHPFREGVVRALRDVGPRVSCLMVSRGHWSQARFAISCYQRQIYRDRELVIVTANPGPDFVENVEALGDPSISIHVLEGESPSLGAQRNLTMAHARGEFVCTWDDDDLYAPSRISAMLSAILESDADVAFLRQEVVWWPAMRGVCITMNHQWENSMVARREVVPPYPDLSLGEDTAVTYPLKSAVPCVIVDAPDLYLYIGHGQNACADTHFARLFSESVFSIPPHRYDRAMQVLSLWFDDLPELQAFLESRAGPPVLNRAVARGVRAAQAIGPADAVSKSSGRVRHWLIALEFGSGLGHVLPACRIARELLAAGHRVTLVVNAEANRAPVDELLGHPSFGVLDAPSDCRDAGVSSTPADSFVDLLRHGGYDDVDRLSDRLAPWCDLLDVCRPDEVLSDFAPTALLAARCAGIPATAIGTGFTVPPNCTPWPSFKYWVDHDGDRRALQEARMLAACNEVLQWRGVRPLASAAEIFHSRPPCITAFPMLDPYAAWRTDPAYWQTLLPAAEGGPVNWVSEESLRVLVYLRGESAAVAPLLDVLSRSDCEALVFAPGLAQSTPGFAGWRNIRLLASPVEIEDVIGSADLVVCHGGVGTVSVCLRAGVPMVLLPMQAEQAINGLHLTASGAAVVFHRPGDLTASAWHQAVATLVDDPRSAGRLAKTAGDIARRWPDPSVRAFAAHLMERADA